MTPRRTFNIEVLGCKVNQVEARMLAGQLAGLGWRAARDGESPDLVLVHSCTVTRRADRDTRKRVASVRRKHPQARIVVSGCLAELEAEVVGRWDGVAAVIPQAQRPRAGEICEAALRGPQAATREPDLRPDAPEGEGFFKAFSPDGSLPSRAFIKVEDGCDGVCAYCRVRLARGRPVSRPLASVLAAAQDAVQAGFHELVLTGVNLGCWRPGLPELLAGVAGVPGDFRVRLTSVEPQHLSRELFQVMRAAGDKVCPHLHIPIQSGDDHVLAAMRRTYTSAELARRVAEGRGLVPGLAVSADIIVGFPGETQAAFENSRRLLRDLGVFRTHVFTFSRRPGTSAAKRPDQVLERVKTERARELRAVSAQAEEAFMRSLIGRTVAVLAESDGFRGTTEHYLKALISGPAAPGDLVRGTAAGVSGGRLRVDSQADRGRTIDL